MTAPLPLLLVAACHDEGADKDPDGGGGDPTNPTTACGPACDAIPTTTRFARLTSLQWENSVQDLLFLPGPTGLSDSFIGDPLSAGFDNDATNLQVGPELFLDYQNAAETLAAQVVADLNQYGLVAPQDPRAGGGGPAYSATVEGEDAAATTGTSVGSAWLLWSQGDLTADFDLPADGTYALSARVWADQAGPDLAHLTMGLDGQDQLEQDVVASSEGAAEVVTVQVDASAGPHTMHVTFTNDYYQDPEDRNLYVDWMAIEGGSGLGGSQAGDAERDEWIAWMGRRAHRRALSSEEIAAYTALFDAGPELVGSGDDFADGVQVVLTAMLQSPWFLYRSELSTAQDADGRIPLSADELASKLSYALWNSMPDDALFAAADDGTLVDEDVLRAQAERLLDDPRAHDTIADLDRQWLHLDNYANIYKDPGLYPEFTETTPQSMVDEAQAFVDDVVFGGGSVRDLFTSPRTFVNADLAPIYGVPGIHGSTLVPADLDPNERAGLLTLSGFLALEADAYISSPIRRGVFVNLDVLCVDLPPPPGVVPALPPPDGQQTTRDLVEGFTGAGTCGEGCHSTLINPPGFAFESFDALGRYRDTEYGLPIDSSGTYSFSTGPETWTDTVAFANVLGNSVDVHRCFSEHLLEYLHGRSVAPEDDATVTHAADAALSGDRPIRDLVVDLVLASSFRYRAPEVP